MAIDWSRGYSCEWRLFRVDPSTFLDCGLVGGVDEAVVDRVEGGLLESGTVTLTRVVGAGMEDGYHRLVLVASQGVRSERVELATLWCSASSAKADHGVDALTVECRSVLWPASRTRLLAGTYAPEGADGAAWAARLLSGCLSAPVEVEGSFEIGSHVVCDLDSTCLDAARLVLGAGGWRLRVDGHGTVRVCPAPSTPAAEVTGRSVTPGVTHSLDTSGVPNRYTAIVGGHSATAENDDPSSPTSHASRGWWDDVVDPSPALLAGETLAAYARRRLAEASAVGRSYGYVREFEPGVAPGDLVRLRLPGAGVDATARVTRQRVEAGHGVKVTEEAEEEVRTWTP